MAKERLDKLLVERGLAESRTRAQALILAGHVLVAEQRADKPGQMIFPALATCLANGAPLIALIKPQFEVGRGEVGRGGIVTDPQKHRRVLYDIARAAASMSLLPVAVIESPILGAEGNREFLMHLQK